MNEINRTKDRIVWIDIYKALAITLVVIGHATGLFNRYIYQFHIAAFFFISGYVVKLEQETFIKTVIKRLYTLIFPLLTCIIINACIMDMLYKKGFYTLIFGELDYLGFVQIIKLFFTTGGIYAWLLGAGWFLVVLFFVSVIVKLLWNLSFNSSYLFLGYTILLYVLGYMAVKSGYIKYALLNLSMIAQFFYGVGYLVKEKQGKRLMELRIAACIVVFFVTSFILYFTGKIPNITVDYASGTFSNIWLNTFTSIIGILWLFCLASLLSRIKSKPFIHICTVIGQNTMGIMLLHFIIFKIVFALLYIMNIVDINEISNVVPSTEIGYKYWGLFLIISESVSVVVWMLIKKIPVLNIFIGVDRNVVKKIDAVLSKPIFVKRTNTELPIKKYLKNVSFVVLLGCYTLLLVCFGVQRYKIYQAVDVKFPNSLPENIVKFEGGWQPQSDETYRWIADQGTIAVNSKRHSNLLVSGYVPEDFCEVTMLQIYVDGQLLDTIDVTINHWFEKSYDISGMVSEKMYRITFDFDGVHKPEAGSAEIRELSGMFTRICIE